jgi:hypothetical protein
MTLKTSVQNQYQEAPSVRLMNKKKKEFTPKMMSNEERFERIKSNEGPMTGFDIGQNHSLTPSQTEENLVPSNKKRVILPKSEFRDMENEQVKLLPVVSQKEKELELKKKHKIDSNDKFVKAYQLEGKGASLMFDKEDEKTTSLRVPKPRKYIY